MRKIYRVGLLIVGFIFLVHLGCIKKVEEKKSYEIRLKNTKEMILIYLEHTGPYDQMGDVFAQLTEYASRKTLTGEIVGIYYDDPAKVSAEQLRSEVGIVVPEEVMPDSGFKLQTIPAQRVAYAILKGPYGEIAKEYPYMMQWIEKKGYQISGPLMEIYLEAGPNIPSEQLVTEVRIPIKE